MGENVIEQVQFADWGAPLFLVMYLSGTKSQLEFVVILNSPLIRWLNCYPNPRIEDLCLGHIDIKKRDISTYGPNIYREVDLRIFPTTSGYLCNCSRNV